jgi:peptidoglycan hydrolase CwlO-like protein
LAVAASAFAIPTAFADTKDQLDAAKAEVAKIQEKLDAATAEWHEATIALDATKGQILETRRRIRGLEQRVDKIEARLTRRAVIAFTNGPASTIDLLLSSGSFTEFSDRLEFLGQVAQDDVDLVLEQKVARRSSAANARTCSRSRSGRPRRPSGSPRRRPRSTLSSSA